MRNEIAQVFMHEYAELIQSDNGKEFTSKIKCIIIRNISKVPLWITVSSQSQGAIEAFNKRVQISLLAAYDNAKGEKMNCDLEMNFLHFFYCLREHTTTSKISKYVLDNFNNKKVREKVIITTQKSSKKRIKYLYRVEEIVMITNWINKIH